MTKLIAMNGVGFGYPGQAPIFSGINFYINQGERTLILGPNGSGKSTLGLLIAGLLAPTSGEVNRNIQPLKIGIVFQNSRRQMIGSTVEDDLAFGLSLQEMPASKIKDRVELFLDKFKLTSKRHSNINQLSGGELRRLALAGVLITEPQIIILDEPLTMLDREDQVLFLNCLRENVRLETAVIWFDHEVKSIRYTSNWLVLNEKRGLDRVSLKELNLKEFLIDRRLTPAPLQELEWQMPGRIFGAIFGPERINFD